MSHRFLAELDNVTRRWRAVAVGSAAARVVAVAVGVATLLVAVDWLGRFDDTGLRWLFSGVLVTAIGAALYRGASAVRSLDASRLAVARRVEQLHPELGSRLASAVEFHDGAPDDPAAGSAELRRAVVLDAAARVESLALEETIDATPLRRARRWAIGAVLLLAVFTAGSPSAVSMGLARLAAPWADLDWPRQNALELVDRVTAVALGEAFEVAAIDRNGRLPADVRVEYRFASADDHASERPTFETEPMRLIAEQAVARREEVRRPFAYRVVGGDDDTLPWTDVRVVEPPRVADLVLHATPPEYSGLPTGPVSGPVTVLEGTRLGASGAADKPVAAARIELPGQAPIELTIRGEPDSPQLVTETPWIATPSDSFGEGLVVSLESPEGLVGRGAPRPYEVVADRPPTVEWLAPSGDVFVTTRALVPLRVAVEDDLAIAAARVDATASTTQTAPDEAANDEAPLADSANEPIRVELYRGPEAAPPRDGFDRGDRLTLDEEWDLAELRLPVGTRLDLLAIASDYRPAEGAAKLPRRVFVVSDEEVEARLAAKQSRLLTEIERGLDRQRLARDRSEALSIDVDAGRPLDRGTLDRLATLEFEQRQASGAIDDPTGGAVRLAEELLDAIRRNRLERPELVDQLDSARAELADLAGGAMAESRRELAAARRATQRGLGERDAGEVATSLDGAGRRQTEAVERLEAVAEALTGWADYQRFATEIAELRDRQRELGERTQKLAALAAARDPMKAAELQSEQLKAVGAQAEIGRRFAKLRQGMQALLENATRGDEPADAAADAVADALAEADGMAVAADLRDASRQLARQQLGRAGAPQRRAAEGLDRMLDALRQRTGGDPQELIDRLREAQERLAELKQQTEDLADADNPDERADAAEQAERLGRGLERMTAPQAAASTQRGAEGLAGDPTPQLNDAQEAFEQADEQIEERIRELEEQQTQRALDRLAAKIDGYLEQQRYVADETATLARNAGRDGRLAPPQRGAAETLADAEGELEVEVRVSGEELAGRRVFELALRTTADEMRDIADRLADARVDGATLRLEASALARLERIAEVLRSTPQPEQEGGGQGGEGQGGGDQPPSPVDVAELKMLRLMQLDLIDKTEAFEAEAGRVDRDPSPDAGDLREEGQRLSGEQAALIELALEMAQRNNDPDAAAGADGPGDAAPAPPEEQ